MGKIAEQGIENPVNIAAGVDNGTLNRIAVATSFPKFEGCIDCDSFDFANAFPSRQDDLLTQHLRDAARLLEIQLLDHIVLADGSYYSYSDEGTL